MIVYYRINVRMLATINGRIEHFIGEWDQMVWSSIDTMSVNNTAVF